MKTARFIGLDIGSSAIKGVLTDASGSILAADSLDNHLLAPREGWVELDPEQHLSNVCQVLRTLARTTPEPVAAVAMAAAAGNTLLTTAEGRPLGNIISWMDQRAQQQPPRLLAAVKSATLRRITGWPCVDAFPLAHLAWLKEWHPEALENAAHAGMDSDWLLQQLCGHRYLDHSTATTFHLLDQLSGTYHQPFLDLLGLQHGQLPQLVPSGTSCGTVLPSMTTRSGLSQATLIVSGSFDHPAAARAVAVTDPGQLMLSCGTSWVGFVPCRDRQRIIQAGMLCDPFLHQEQGCWGGMFSVPQIGRQITWYLEHLIAPQSPPAERLRLFDELSASAPAGAEGLTLDLREPPRSSSAPAALLSRAVMESAARLLAQQLQELEHHGFSYNEAIMVGGASRSPIWPRIVAQITGLEIRTGGRAAGARGAALLAKRAWQRSIGARRLA